MTSGKKSFILNTLDSLLFVPAVQEKFFSKLVHLNGIEKPSGIIFDLEDSVSETGKEKARETLLHFFSNESWKNFILNAYTVIIRINPTGSRFLEDDLNLLKRIHPDILMLSKVESKDEIFFYKKICKKLFVGIETLKGIENLENILKVLEDGDFFALGYEDLSGELKMERPINLNTLNPLTHLIMNAIVQARRFNIPIIDAVSRFFKTAEDLSVLKDEILFTSNLGFFGKVAIHPNQIKYINKIFREKKKSMNDRAKIVIEQFDKLNDGSFVIVDDNNNMLDTPSYKMANNILTK